MLFVFTFPFNFYLVVLSVAISMNSVVNILGGTNQNLSEAK